MHDKIKLTQLWLTLLLLTFAWTGKAWAWSGMEMKPLHVEGNQLCDPDGNPVQLHGIGQTYNPYFNSYAWCTNGKDILWGETKNSLRCRTWAKKVLSDLDSKGWKVNWLRLHMDPHWSNDPAKVQKWEREHPNERFDESVIDGFDETLFEKYLDELFIPMAKHAISLGMYVVMRPPGVCPQQIKVGDNYHKYLLKVWSIVLSREELMNNPYVMFELANEPVAVWDGSNYTNWSDGSMKNTTLFFQQIVDMMREKGSNNILWVPGMNWQQNYKGFAKYPIKGENIGYAVHCYPGWYGSDCEDEKGSHEHGIPTKGHGYFEFQAGWDENVMPAAKIRPILITEMDWAPMKYNNSWGKATTGTAGGVGFGANFKYIMDKTGNVSWMLFTDADKLLNYDDNAPDGATFLTDPEACPRPIYRWYKEYADPDYTFVDTLAPKIEEIKKQRLMFPGTEVALDPNIWEKGSYDPSTKCIKTGQYGFAGWKFAGGLDLSKWKYLVVKFSRTPESNAWSLRLFDQDNYWTDPYMNDFGQKTQAVVTLSKMTNKNGTKINPKNIFILGFWSLGNTPLYIDRIYLTNNDDYSEETTSIDLPCIGQPVEVYDVAGRCVLKARNRQEAVSKLRPGIYIIDRKKLIIR